MRVEISELEKKTVAVDQYIESLDEFFREKFLARKNEYKLDSKVVNQLKEIANEYMVVAFSAGWCKDCATNISVLALISEATELKVRIFGGIKKDPLSHIRKWRIPPSPPEVETFNVDKLPLIIIFNKEGEEIGRIIENPREPTLEEELLKIILRKQQNSS